MAYKSGRKEGRKERDIEIAKKLLSMGVSKADVSTATGLTKDEIEKL